MATTEHKEVISPVAKPVNFEQMLIDCLGCKWTLKLLDCISREVSRPGHLVREVDGLTTKVLNQNLTRMLDYGLLVKHVYAERPPRVEYQLTSFGVEIYQVLLKLKEIQGRHIADSR